LSDRIRQAGEFAWDAFQKGARQAGSDLRDGARREGFSSAAGIALSRIEDSLDALKERMRGNGPSMTEADLALFAHLDDLKSEIEVSYDRYWRGSGVQWRPPKAVAKGIVRRTQEPEA
jgi:hypothetical protein